MKFRVLPVAFLVAIASLLSGCAVGGKFPSTWSRPSPTSGTCDKLAGSFVDVGASAEYPNSKPRLSALFQFPYKDWEKADYLKIAIDESAKVSLEIWARGQFGDTQIPSKSKLIISCKSGSLYWEGSLDELSEGHGKDNPLFGVQHGKYEIARGTDNALYVLRSESGGGLIYMFLPIAYSDSSWYRFDAVR